MTEYAGLFDNIPWLAVIIGIVIGFFLARKFPNIFPTITAQADNNTILRRIDVAAGDLADRLDKK